MTTWLARRREPSLRRNISRQCHCSRRVVYLLDKKYGSIGDEQMSVFLNTRRPPASELVWNPETNDCDDPARRFWNKSKDYFAEKGVNAPIGFITRAGTPLLKPHAFNFYIRKPDNLLVFVDRYNRVPLLTRATFVLM